ncbi:uncharacterized protein LOC115220920 [Octopus sinensis]|uniref:Uncharacterized protein LOC115220920 n=1 Tax=Octopus sinensis TaxID=2607531 RepID=A0A6P7T9B8_9MOLL|nr:uncharacterized protein LOC115220920 [Octopus sinensis]
MFVCWKSIFFLFLCLKYLLAETSELIFEAEKQPGNLKVHSRSNASNKKVVYLLPGKTLRLDLCIANNSSLRMMGFRYSIDGKATVVLVNIDNQQLQSFSISGHSKGGELWNVFRDSGPARKPLFLSEGIHFLDIHINSNETQGIEIDHLTIMTDNPYISEDLMSCRLSCFHELDKAEPVKKDHTRRSDLVTLIQRSFPTKCAEQDNIDIAFIHASVKKYRVTPSYPRFDSMLNNRGAMFKDCFSISQSQLWLLKGKPLDPEHNVVMNINSFVLKLTKSRLYKFIIFFPLKGKMSGVIDADIGSNFTVKLKKISRPLYINMTYNGRNSKLSELQHRKFSPRTLKGVWSIPDFTWSESNINAIFLILVSDEDQLVIIDEISLVRRPERGETVKPLYQSLNTILEGVNVDFWWRRPKTMSVILEGTKFDNIDFIRLSKRVLGSSDTSQVFVLYQDGNARTLPPLLHGVDWLPFGSSVILGPTNLSSFRPFADIEVFKIVRVEPTLIAVIQYYDNSSANIEVISNRTQTQILVYNISMASVSTFLPFIRFRSMWIKDGLSDVDHIKIDGDKGLHILSTWRILRARNVRFYRSCESKHLSMSPNIKIEILK